MSIITPEWVHHAVFYQIFPDRFARSARAPQLSGLEPWTSKPTTYGYKGGDLWGVIEKLDYLKDLGVTAIYFCPIFQSTANHRYHTHDYFRIDPVLGGDEAFDALIKAAHKKKMRIVLDGVFNHASRGFYQFNHALENGASSPYLDWFHIHGFPLHAYEGTPKYDAWWNIPALPKFNTKTPAVREYLWRVGEHWVERGIDGWRLDVPAEIDDDAFWREFRRRVKAKNPEAYIVGEIWHEAQRWLQGDQFDAVMNYVFTRAAVSFFTGGKWDPQLVDGAGQGQVSKLDASGFAYALNRVNAMYPWEIVKAQLNLLDSHDTARFLSIARGDVEALKLALACMLTLPGAPCIYYGDEIGLAGGKDPDCRRSFDWDEDTWNLDLHKFVKSTIKLRNTHRALRDGDFRVLFAEDNCVAYLRKYGAQALITILNAGQQELSIGIHTQDFLPAGTRFKQVFGRRNQSIVRDGILNGLTVPGRACVVLANA
jgi:cyclomaltodextrinase / maltogenic alpha-amylase / neopullulanase